MFRMYPIQPSLFPQYLWLGYLHTVAPDTIAVVEQRATHYTLACEMNAPVGIRWIRKGRETAPSVPMIGETPAFPLLE